MNSVMRAATFPRPQRSAKLFSDFNNLQFASVMALVMFVLLLIFMTIPMPYHDGSTDLPRVLHPTMMRGANREDALRITVSRDGQAYLGSERVVVEDISAKLKDRLKDSDIEKKVYITADARARWATVKLVLEQVREAGILRVAFLATERHFYQ